jgi:hypothetical protein
VLRYVPAVAGVLLVVAGMALFSLPLGLVALGAVLLLVDRRLS